MSERLHANMMGKWNERKKVERGLLVMVSESLVSSMPEKEKTLAVPPSSGMPWGGMPPGVMQIPRFVVIEMAGGKEVNKLLS